MPNLSSWTREEEKAFENAIATHSIDDTTNDEEEQWDKIAEMVPTKTMEEIKEHYEFLVEDVGAIEAGKVPLPKYTSDVTTTTTTLVSTSNKEDFHPSSFSKEQKGNNNNNNNSNNYNNNKNNQANNGYSAFGPSSIGNSTKANSKLDQERKKGIPWTEEEHRLFLLGLDKFGKGDWRSISRNFVITRTPTQVASHAQKYFIRLNSMNRDRRRSSIHDITNVNGGGGGGLSPNQAPITGQQNAAAAVPAVGNAAAPNKHRPQTNVNMAPAPGMGMYGTQMGHPVTAAPQQTPHHMVSAVGTPVMLPPPGHPHHHHHHHHHPPPHYAVPVAYPVPPPPMHR